MGVVALELRSPQTVHGITVDPDPDWTFESLLLELNSIEEKLNVSHQSPLPFTKKESCKLPAPRDDYRKQRGFVMSVSDYEVDDYDSDAEVEFHDRSTVAGRRFGCDEVYLSDDSEDESALGIHSHLIDKVGLVEGALSELTHEHRLLVTEEVRNQILALETDLVNEKMKFASTLAQVEKYTEAQRDLDRKLDMHYQRRIAEALDNHLTAVQRDHEHRSQIEERRIRDDAAREEAKRREKANQEEKLRQEKLQAEMLAKLEAERAEAAKAAVLEAQRKEAEEAAEKKRAENLQNVATGSLQGEEANGQPSSRHELATRVETTGNMIRAAENALILEERRLQIYKEVASKNQELGFGSSKEYQSHGMQIARRIRTIAGSRENVRIKADELVKLIGDSPCPQSISIAIFAEKVVSLCANPTKSFNSAMFAYGRVIVQVTSKLPIAMDILISELNRVCIYTVPKYMSYSEASFGSRAAYFRAIGYQEEDGNIESTDSYLERLRSYMKLYGALVQTEVGGFQNLHGLAEGWAWLARFLNSLPANLYTAVALQAFLEMAGFALHKRYKSQFKKMLDVISREFIRSLGKREDPKLNSVITNIRNYIESNQFLSEPEGWQLRSSLESHTFAPDSGQEQYRQYSPNRYYY